MSEAATIEAIQGDNSTLAYDVARVRADFPILTQEVFGHPLVYLDSAASAQKPRQVIEAMDDAYRTHYSNVHRGVHRMSQLCTDAVEAGRETVARYINAGSSDEIVFTRNATEAINLVADCFGRAFLKAGDEVIISTLGHHSNIVPWQILCEQTGAVLKVAPINDAGELLLDGFEKLLSERTRFVAITHVSNALGTINPVRKIVEIAHREGVPVLLDGAQAAPHLKIDVRDIGCDFYAITGHKMFGPTGIGILYGKESLLAAMPPYKGGGDMILEVSFAGTTYNELPYKFEAGTPNIADAIATGAAVDYLSDLGMDNVWQHEQELTAYAMEQILSMDNIRVLGPQDPTLRGGVISFIHDTIHPHDLGTALDQQGIAIRTGHHCAMPLIRSFDVVAAARASFYIYNTKSEVDALINGISETEGYFSR